MSQKAEKLEPGAPACSEVFRAAAEVVRNSDARDQAERVTMSCVRGWNDGLLHWLDVGPLGDPPDGLPR